jgi:hypothetical protein
MLPVTFQLAGRRRVGRLVLHIDFPAAGRSLVVGKVRDSLMALHFLSPTRFFNVSDKRLRLRRIGVVVDLLEGSRTFLLLFAAHLARSFGVSRASRV